MTTHHMRYLDNGKKTFSLKQAQLCQLQQAINSQKFDRLGTYWRTLEDSSSVVATKST